MPAYVWHSPMRAAMLCWGGRDVHHGDAVEATEVEAARINADGGCLVLQSPPAAPEPVPELVPEPAPADPKPAKPRRR